MRAALKGVHRGAYYFYFARARKKKKNANEGDATSPYVSVEVRRERLIPYPLNFESVLRYSRCGGRIYVHMGLEPMTTRWIYILLYSV